MVGVENRQLNNILLANQVVNPKRVMSERQTADEQIVIKCFANHRSAQNDIFERLECNLKVVGDIRTFLKVVVKSLLIVVFRCLGTL